MNAQMPKAKTQAKIQAWEYKTNPYADYVRVENIKQNNSGLQADVVVYNELGRTCVFRNQYYPFI